MDPISIGAVVAGAKTGIEVIKQAADAVSAIRSAASGPDGQKTAPVDVAKLDDLADKLSIARVRALDAISLAEQLQLENIQLREEAARRDRFLARSGSYKLIALKEGAVAYQFVGDATTAPNHLVCPTCFENERIHTLQPTKVEYGTTRMSCPVCQTGVLIGNDHQNPIVRRNRSRFNP